MKGNWICGIDIGSSKIAGVVGRTKGETLSIFGTASVDAAGITQGVVSDLGEASSAVKELVDRLEFQTKLRLEGALVAIQGSHLECVSVQGNDLVSEKGREITPREVRRALQAAQSVSLPMNRRVIHALLQGYVVDGQEGIRNPIGMYATRFRVHLKVITGASSLIQNAVTCVHRAGLEAEGVVFSGYATALAVLEREERNFGCGLLEIGEGMSTFLAFRGGGVTHLKVFPIGGGLITQRIAEHFQIPLLEAETLKKQVGSLVLTSSAEDHEFLVHDGSRQKVVRRAELCEVIRGAVEKLLQTFKKEVKELPSPNATLVLSGGTSLLEGVVEEANHFFQCRTRLGEIQDTHSARPLPLPFATSVGLLRYGYEKQKEERELLPESTIGKVYAKVKELFLDYF